jgi:hypothetical protein
MPVAPASHLVLARCFFKDGEFDPLKVEEPVGSMVLSSGGIGGGGSGGENTCAAAALAVARSLVSLELSTAAAQDAFNDFARHLCDVEAPRMCAAFAATVVSAAATTAAEGVAGRETSEATEASGANDGSGRAALLPAKVARAKAEAEARALKAARATARAAVRMGERKAKRAKRLADRDAARAPDELAPRLG